MEFQFALLLGLFVKHFFCDFPLQAFPWMYLNKGSFIWWRGVPIFPHFGGVVHAAIHGVGTSFVVLATLRTFEYQGSDIFWVVGLAASFDAALHYIIDFVKVNATRYFGLLPNNSEWFWVFLGFDQLLHSLTYFFIAYFIPVVG